MSDLALGIAIGLASNSPTPSADKETIAECLRTHTDYTYDKCAELISSTNIHGVVQTEWLMAVTIILIISDCNRVLYL